MKVLHIEERFHPEIGYQLNFFAKFHNPEFEFVILTSNSFSLWEGTDANDIMVEKDKEFEKKYNVKIIRTSAKFDRKGKYYIWLNDLAKHIKQILPDLIYIHGVDTITFLRLMFSRSLLKKYPFVSDTHTLLNQFSDTPKFKAYLSIIKLIAVKAINKYSIPVFYTTPENKYILEKLYKINAANINSCLIGTDTSAYFYDMESKHSLRKQLHFNEDDKVILYVGKLRFSKGPHLILEAISLFENKVNKPLKLVFIGHKEQAYFTEYFNFSFQNPLIQVVILPPVKNEILYQYYSMADFAVFPKENTLSSLDSQACKLPLIMEEDTTNIERLKKGGLVYKRDDINDLSSKIYQLLSNPIYAHKLGSDGYDFVKQNFDYNIIIKNMESVLKIAYYNFHKKRHR